MTKVVSCIHLEGGAGNTALAVSVASYCGVSVPESMDERRCDRNTRRREPVLEKP